MLTKELSYWCDPGSTSSQRSLVIDNITQAIPPNRINVDKLKVLEGIELTDTEFYKSSRIDLHLGADLFFDLMCIGRIKTSRT